MSYYCGGRGGNEFLLPDHKIKTHHVIENEEEELIAEIPCNLMEKERTFPRRYGRLDVTCKGKKYENVSYRINDDERTICVRKKDMIKNQYNNDSFSEELSDTESESIPEYEYKEKKKEKTMVTELTSKNFDEIVMDSTKDVMVKFYAPWCGHCIHLAPIYEDVAKNHGMKDVVIAEIDATKYGDIAKRFAVEGFPTIKWFRKSQKENPIDYRNERTKSDFIRFIKNNQK